MNIETPTDETGITAFCAVTACGIFLPDMYITEGVYWTDNWLKFAGRGAAGFKRKGGYFITAEVFKLMLMELAKHIPGGAVHCAFPPCV